MSKKFEEYEEEYEIREDRGWLPSWWVVLIVGGIIVGFGYGIWFHGIAGASQAQDYDTEVAYFKKAQPKAVVKLADDGSNPLRNDAGAIKRGQKSYMGYCAACHKPDMSGIIGPSLADTKWLHGATDKEVYDVIMDGVQMDKARQTPPKGPMPPHGKSLGTQKVLEVLAYIASKNSSLIPK